MRRCIAKLERIEGVILSKGAGIRWLHLPVGVHDLSRYPSYQSGSRWLRSSDLVSVTLFEGPGCGGRFRVVSGTDVDIGTVRVDEKDEDYEVTFGERLSCVQVERRYGAVLYSKPHFQGEGVFVAPGKHGNTETFMSAHIASVRLQEHVNARVYARKYYVGHYVFLDNSIADLAQASLPESGSIDVTGMAIC